jgi:hypothetical protein
MEALTMSDIVPVSSTPLVPADMDQAIRLAKAMSSAKMLPKHLQDDVGTCLMIVEQAMRWRMSPFAVAQCTSSIGGKLMWEGKLVAAAVETSGAIEGHFDYDFGGEGDDRQVTVSARRRGETNPRQMTIRLRDVRTSNEHWKKQPDQMLVYSSTRNWARRFTPAVILGVYSPEEFSRETEPPHNGPTIDHEPPVVPMRAAAASMPRAERVADPTVYQAADPLDEQDGRKWMDNLTRMLANAQSQDEVVEIAGHSSVGNATANAPEAVKRRLTELLANAYGRFADLSDEALGEVEIAGAEKLGAG